jgi:maltose operon periplasmic protein
MSRFHTPTLAFCLLLIVGCAGPEQTPYDAFLESVSPYYKAISTDPAASLEVLGTVPVCCERLSDLRYQPLNTKSDPFFKLDANSQAFAFSTGKSLLQAFVIPDELERATLTIESIAGATVFVPTVLILNRDFQVTRAIDSRNFKYTPGGFMEPQRLRGKVYLDRRKGSELADEKYLIVFTTDQDLRGSTRMMSEAKLFARAHGLKTSGLPDPVVRHAATGVFRMGVGDLETAALTTERFHKQQRGANRYLDPAMVKTNRATEQRRARRGTKPRADAPATRPGTDLMLKETQTMYDRMIRESVGLGDMDRAWRLVQEAERAGSTTARSTFVSAIENK